MSSIIIGQRPNGKYHWSSSVVPAINFGRNSMRVHVDMNILAEMSCHPDEVGWRFSGRRWCHRRVYHIPSFGQSRGRNGLPFTSIGIDCIGGRRWAIYYSSLCRVFLCYRHSVPKLSRRQQKCPAGQEFF
eukprot:scaffold37865_cov40-Attheya_sp.AAC.2